MKKFALNLVLFLLTSGLSAQQPALLGALPLEVRETSGLIYHNGKLITHNDSGNSAELFEIDVDSRQINRVVSVQNAINVDWEDLAQDDTYIYIGDIGNNNGNRTDLVVYRILKSDFDSSDSVTAERIDYSYEDQQDFTSMPASDWDAEGLTVIGDQLILFTKRWQSGGTRVYSIPTTPGNHLASNIGSGEFSGLVTGAVYNPLSGVLYLLGYSSQLIPFLIRYENLSDPLIFEGSVPIIGLGIGFAQAEAITYFDEDTYYFSSEEFINNNPPITLNANLYILQTEDRMVEPEPGPEPEPVPEPDPEPPLEDDGDGMILYRQFGTDLLFYELNTEEDVFGRAVFDLSGRLLEYTPASEIQSRSIDISVYGNSVYYLTIYLRNKIISKGFVTN